AALRAARCCGAAELADEPQIGKREARLHAQGVIAPRSGVDVEQLELLIAWIELVFELDEAVVVDGPQKALRQILEHRQVHGLHERAGPAEFRRVLPPAPDDHAADRLSVLEKRTVGELLPAVARDQLLNHHFAGRDQRCSLAESLIELRAAARAPGLALGRVD